MSFPVSSYIEECDGALRIAGTRVGLDSVVAHFQAGRTPEQIAHSFPAIQLAQVYGAIAYYLENKQVVDDHMAETQRELEQIPPLSQTNPELFARLEAARRQLFSKRT